LGRLEIVKKVYDIKKSDFKIFNFLDRKNPVIAFIKNTGGLERD